MFLAVLVFPILYFISPYSDFVCLYGLALFDSVLISYVCLIDNTTIIRMQYISWDITRIGTGEARCHLDRLTGSSQGNLSSNSLTVFRQINGVTIGPGATRFCWFPLDWSNGPRKRCRVTTVISPIIRDYTLEKLGIMTDRSMVDYRCPSLGIALLIFHHVKFENKDWSPNFSTANS